MKRSTFFVPSHWINRSIQNANSQCISTHKQTYTTNCNSRFVKAKQQNNTRKKSAELFQTIINLGQYISNPICYTRVHCFAYIITTTSTIIFNWCFSDYLNEKGKSCGIIIEFILVVLAVLIYSSHRQHYHQSLFDKVNVYYKTIWTQNYGGKKIERAKKAVCASRVFFVGWSLFIFFFTYSICARFLLSLRMIFAQQRTGKIDKTETNEIWVAAPYSHLCKENNKAW